MKSIVNSQVKVESQSQKSASQVCVPPGSEAFIGGRIMTAKKEIAENKVLIRNCVFIILLKCESQHFPKAPKTH